MKNSSSGMLQRVAFVRTDVAEKRITSTIRVKRIGELGTTLAITNNRSTLRRSTMLSHIVFLRSVLRLLIIANVVLSALILAT
jgi:hypothetical protein